MRAQIFTSGIAILAIGFFALRVLEQKEGFGFLTGSLTLGGALVICGGFVGQMRWHGLIGAGVIALLGAARGVTNLKDLPAFLSGDRSRGPAPLMELGVTLICVLLLLRVIRALRAERVRQMLESDESRGRRP